jgi:GT2 family glycosyltransferase
MQAQISLLIITYNRPDDLLDLLKSLSRQQNIEVLQEVLILNNASTLSYQQAEDFIAVNPQLKITYLRSQENLGVSRGRNKLMSMASGELLLILDDDIVFQQPDDLLKVAGVFETPLFKNEKTAIVTFRVIYYDTKEVQQTAFPHKRFEEYKNKESFLTYYFAGCAHILKKGMLQQTGLYPEDFFYGMEEYDLSYRVIDAGYSIGYSSSITFEHKESPKGRSANYQKLSSQWINKSKVAWRYLPAFYYLTTMTAWSIEYIRKIQGHWGTYFQSWAKALAIPFSEKRKPISAEAMKYLRKVNARLKY